MDKPISGSLPIARPGCAFCARKPISYGRCSGGRFASRDRRSCCLHLGAAFHREEVTNVPLRVVHRDCIVLCHPNFHGADPFEKDAGNRQFAIKPSRNLYADSGNSICRPGPGFGTCLRRNARAKSLTSLELSSRRIIKQVSNDKDRSDSVRTATPSARSPKVLGQGKIATPAPSDTK